VRRGLPAPPVPPRVRHGFGETNVSASSCKPPPALYFLVYFILMSWLCSPHGLDAWIPSSAGYHVYVIAVQRCRVLPRLKQMLHAHLGTSHAIRSRGDYNFSRSRVPLLALYGLLPVDGPDGGPRWALTNRCHLINTWLDCGGVICRWLGQVRADGLCGAGGRGNGQAGAARLHAHRRRRVPGTALHHPFSSPLQPDTCEQAT
jgi:hypothetical protein